MSTAKFTDDHDSRTRKQRREHARVQRKELERAQATNAARRTRMRWLAALLAVVLVGVAVVVIAAPKGGAASKIAPGSSEARGVSAEVRALLAGIPQSGNVLGQPTAPVTLQYFGDLECPVCRSFTLTALPSIIHQWVRSGTLRIEYRSLETATREPEVFTAQQTAALAAGPQHKTWNYVETFYHEQQEEDSGYVTETYLEGIAKQVPGLNLATWAADRSAPALARQVSSDADAAANDNLDGTPAFLIGTSGGAMHQLEPSSFTSPGSFNEAIEKLARS